MTTTIMTPIERVMLLAEELTEKQKALKEKEEELKVLERQVRTLEQEDLPELMQELGMTAFKLEDGSVVELTPDFKVGITEEKSASAIKWLVDNEFGGIVKTQVVVEFGRGETERAKQLNAGIKNLLEEGETSRAKPSVHYQTLKSFVKERLAEEKPAVPFPMDLFGVHPFNKATIKLPKKSKKRTSKR